MRPNTARITVVSGLLILLMMTTFGCQTLGDVERVNWPSESARTTQIPSELQGLDPEQPVIKAASDGFVYLVTSDETAMNVGDQIRGVYAGEWPLEGPRPALMAGQVVESLGEGVYSLHVTYAKNDIEVDGLRAKRVKEGEAPVVGKGITDIEKYNKKSRVMQLRAGRKSGLRKGDIYALLGDRKSNLPTSMQLSQRLVGLCKVVDLRTERARCRLLKPNRAHPANFVAPKRADMALFVEHRLRPQQPTEDEPIVFISSPESSHGNSVRERVSDVFGQYFGGRLDRKKVTERLDTAVDATAYDFFSYEDKVPSTKTPSMLVGASVVDKQGRPHLIVNYTGVGSAWGPGMVAAPPKGGVDLGPVGDVERREIEAFAAVVWAGYLVYRGETSRALLHMAQMLRDGSIRGAFRWHLRDQFAMRWGVFGHMREALWLVLQDEQIAEDRYGREARLNAMGTRVRLYDFLGLSQKALQLAETYYLACEHHKPNSVYLSALSMYAEMAMVAGKPSKALQLIHRLEQEIPEDKQTELKYLVTGAFWSMPRGDGEDIERAEKRLMEIMTANQSMDQPPREMAFVRFYQGVNEFREGNGEQALVALFEAARLYRKAGDRQGEARAKYFTFLTQLQRTEPQQAFNEGNDVIDLETKMGDYRNRADVYRYMATLYSNPSYLEKPGQWIRGANRILSSHIQHQMSMGRFGAMAEGLLKQASFYAKIGRMSQSRSLIEEAVSQGVSNVRFDVAAMGHLYLAMIAKREGNEDNYDEHVELARQMAALADDPSIAAAIEKVLQSGPSSDVPTTIL